MVAKFTVLIKGNTEVFSYSCWFDFAPPSQRSKVLDSDAFTQWVCDLATEKVSFRCSSHSDALLSN